MFETMKIIHMLALMGGGAATIANGLLLKKVMAGGGPPPDMVKSTMKIIGMIGLVSIVLLWISGGIMSAQMGYGVDTLYAIKLLGATVVLAGAVGLSVIAGRAEKAGTPPPLATMKKLSSVMRGAVLIAVVFAVLVFN